MERKRPVFSRRFLKITASVLSALLVSEPLLAVQREADFWSTRRIATQSPSSKKTEPASLFPASPVLPALSSTVQGDGLFPVFNESAPALLPPSTRDRLSRVLAALGGSDGTVRRITPAKGKDQDRIAVVI